MKKTHLYLMILAITLGMTVGELFARGGGGGGRGGGGGGGARPGGGGGGVAARPSAPAVNRSPSMSRVNPPLSANRPSAGVNRPTQLPSGANRPPQASMGANRPTQFPTGSTLPTRGANAGVRPRSEQTARPGNIGQGGNLAAGQRPTQGQLDNFLNMPGQANAGSRISASPLPGRSSSGEKGLQSKSVTTPGGSTITVASGKGSATTPGGATVGGAGAGVKVEGPGGQTFAKGTGVAGATNGAKSAIAGGSVSSAQGRGGYTAVNARGGVASGGTARVGSVTAVRGPGGNVVAAGRGASFVNGQFVGGRSWAAVNGAFTHWNCFTPGWWGSYPGAWYPGRWAFATTAWATATWAIAGDYCGCSGDPIYYDYGENLTYDDGTVYSGEEPIASAEQYYDEANKIAASAEDSDNEEWLPLGVFAVMQKRQEKPEKVVQLAINKDGAIHGNLHDSLTENVVQVLGAVDKQTQRVAMHLQGNDDILVETGLYNLTNDEVPAIVHLGADQQVEITLIRLEQPNESAETTGP